MQFADFEMRDAGSKAKTKVHLDRVMAQAVSRRPFTAAARVRAQVIPVGFVVDKVALGHVFLRVLRFSPISIIPPHFRK
jgi:hypothetical protein